RVGGKYSHLWHVRHMEDPRSTSPSSNMPSFSWLLERELDLAPLGARLRALARLGVPYDDATIAGAPELAREQAAGIAREVEEKGGPGGLADKEIVALVAYLQRLGADVAP